MDQLLVTLDSFPRQSDGPQSESKYDSELKEYVAALSQLPENARSALRVNPSQAFEILHQNRNSLGFLVVLDILIGSKKELDQQILTKVVEFLNDFDPIAVRYAGSSFRRLLENVVSGSLFPSTVAVKLASNAILRLDPSCSVFTSIHVPLLRLAAETATYEPVLEFIECDITAFPQGGGPKENAILCRKDLSPTLYITPTTGLTEIVKAAAVLEYNALRGTVFISQRNWAKSRDAFELVITHPTKERGISKIMTDTHKKWVLVSLLCDGRAPNLPAAVSQTAKVSYSTLSALYMEVASLFDTNNASKLKEVCSSNQITWQEDGNHMLLDEVMKSYHQWQIINLRDVYSQVPVSKVQSLTLSAETGERLGSVSQIIASIQEMLDSGMLHGHLEHGEGGEDMYLVFDENKSILDEKEFATQIATSHQHVEALSGRYKAANERLSSSKEYVRHMIREQKRAAEKDGHDQGIGVEGAEEEDLMTGIMSNA